MIVESGEMVHEIRRVLGPLKRKAVYVRWFRWNGTLIATVPLGVRYVLRGRLGVEIKDRFAYRAHSIELRRPA